MKKIEGAAEVFQSTSERIAKRCIACGGELLHEAAKVCQICRSSQNQIKNNSLFLANIAGLIAIVFSAITFIATSVADQLKLINWQDSVSVVSFEYPGELAVTNNGSGDVLIVSAEVDWDQSRRHITIPLNLFVPAGEFKVLPLTPYYGAPDGIDRADWASTKLAAERAALFQDSAEDGKTRCSEFHFFAMGHTVFARISQILEGQGFGLLTDLATWRLDIVSLHTGRSLSPPPELPALKVAFLVIGPVCNAPRLHITQGLFLSTAGAIAMNHFRATDAVPSE